MIEDLDVQRCRSALLLDDGGTYHCRLPEGHEEPHEHLLTWTDAEGVPT